MAIKGSNKSHPMMNHKPQNKTSAGNSGTKKQVPYQGKVSVTRVMGKGVLNTGG